MKKISYLLLLLPVCAKAQKIDITERAGVSYVTANTNKMRGFNNQVSVGYHLLKHLELSAFYERNVWNTGTLMLRNNSYGIAPDYTIRHFYFGADLKLATLQSFNDHHGNVLTAHPSYSYGLHAGAKQQAGKHFALTEQIGYQRLHVHETITSPFPGEVYYYVPGGTLPAGLLSPVTTSQVVTTYSYYYLQAGLCYRF